VELRFEIADLNHRSKIGFEVAT